MFVARAIDRTAGGVERMIITVMNALAERGHKIALFTWDTNQSEAYYPLRPGIQWHCLGIGDPKTKAGKLTLLRRARAIRMLIRDESPAAIVCFQDGPFRAMRAYSSGLGVPVLAAERNAPTRFEHSSAGRRETMIFQSLRLAARIIVQFDSYRQLYPSFLHKRIVCIPNPVYPATIQAKPGYANPEARYRLLSVGRLSYQKNFSVLLEAFARLATRFPNWDLVILGEGEERRELESRIPSLGLTHRVLLPGNQRSLTKWYSSAHAFCLPSLWEGFPNALAEALAHGLPSVGFAGCAGVRDLIAHRNNGLLADGNDNVDSLAATLSSVLESGPLRFRMGLAASNSVSQFEPGRIFSLWESALCDVAANQCRGSAPQ
jgi:glycosyltransferase involved in cell wall biosynthesis